MGVTNVQRTVEWYQAMFGLPARVRQEASGRSAATLRIGEGPEFLELVQLAAGEKPRYLHLGFGVRNFDRRTVEAASSEHGVKPQWQTRADESGAVQELFISDPDGLQIQIQDIQYSGGGGRLGNIWNEQWREAPRSASASLRVRCINHATFGSPDKGRIERFYQEAIGLTVISWDYRPGEPSKILGFAAVSPRSFVAPGQGPIGISHYCLGVESFDHGLVVKALAEAGARVRPAGPDRPGCCGSAVKYSATETTYIQDPDGFTVQVTDMDYCAGTGPIGVTPAR
jgi:catechol 2,3-dioxygenase-like lactoylglutathione lyase family enzyme